MTSLHVVALGAFAAAIVIIFEFSHKPKSPVLPRPLEKDPNQVLEGIEQELQVWAHTSIRHFTPQENYTNVHVQLDSRYLIMHRYNVA